MFMLSLITSLVMQTHKELKVLQYYYPLVDYRAGDRMNNELNVGDWGLR